MHKGRRSAWGPTTSARRCEQSPFWEEAMIAAFRPLGISIHQTLRPLEKKVVCGRQGLASVLTGRLQEAVVLFPAHMFKQGLIRKSPNEADEVTWGLRCFFSPIPAPARPPHLTTCPPVAHQVTRPHCQQRPAQAPDRPHFLSMF